MISGAITTANLAGYGFSKLYCWLFTLHSVWFEIFTIVGPVYYCVQDTPAGCNGLPA